MFLYVTCIIIIILLNIKYMDGVRYNLEVIITTLTEIIINKLFFIIISLKYAYITKYILIFSTMIEYKI